MILPIVAFGHPILRKVAQQIPAGYANLSPLISSMWETMYASNGVGLAAPQINKSIRLFVVDTVQVFDNMDEKEKLDYADDKGIKAVFINANIISLTGAHWIYNEGCLSIPKIREDVQRHQAVTLSYCDENFEYITQTFTGITARVILHEYDHIDGRLFIDYLTPLKKRLLKNKLEDISKGKIKVDYKMLFS